MYIKMSGPVKFLYFLLFICFLLVSHAQTPGNISAGSKLITSDQWPLPSSTNSCWRSPSGEFAFGFYPLGYGRFLLGIWFDKIPERTLIWSEDRNSPVPEGSNVYLSLDGQLLLTPTNGGVHSIYSGGDAKSASMQNDGNFVLMDSMSKVLWRSFDYPTDTILPGQTLKMRQRLYSNSNGTSDFSTGRFMLELQSFDGKLVLSAYQFADPGYWIAEYDASQQNVTSIVFNPSTALIYVVNLNVTIYSKAGDAGVPSLPTPINDYYHRATVEDTGNFQQFVHHKVHGSQWTSVWRAIDEPCFVNGVCGIYGFCISPNNQTATCSCLPGYSPKDPNNPYEGCYPDIPAEQCSRAQLQTEYDVEVYDDTNIWNSDFTDLERLFNSTVESCKKAVLDDCFCMAASLDRSSTCLKKRIPFMNARRSSPSTDGFRTFIKILKPTKEGNKSFSSKNVFILSLSISTLLALLFAVIAFYYHPIARRWGLRKPHQNAKKVEVNLRAFTFQELHKATNGFSNKLGKGAFGTVYSGAVSMEDTRMEIAVKKLEKMMDQGEKEFLTEVRVIGKTHHKNLVKLLGYCNEQNHRLLVYELMKNGSLSSFLFKEEKPTWGLRANIALGIARGLLYLHEDCETQIIHCDIKPQNVLLDKQYSAKIADFGLAKLLVEDQTRTSTNVRGTMGYMAPEWLKNAPKTAKVDVYSFGVMLLEIICCRRHIELSRMEEETEEIDLVLSDWVLHSVKQEKLAVVVNYDPEVLSDFKRFQAMAMVGLWCVHPDPILRPTMKNVTLMLEGTIEVGVPPLVNAQFF